jgi:quercetin dioxygenase-like cupin family protein
MTCLSLPLLVTAALLLTTTPACAQASAITSARMNSGEMNWVPFPGDVYRAEIAGDEKTVGLYAYRVKFPAGFKRQPHFHPDDKIVTVLSGTIYIGYGEQFDESAMKALLPGAIWTEPMRQPHYVWVKEGEVVIQVVGFGPTGNTFVQRKP